VVVELGHAGRVARACHLGLRPYVPEVFSAEDQLVRVSRAQHGGVAWQAPRRLGHAPLEAGALSGQRISLKGYLEPEVGDVDIATESVLISVGRGIQNEDNIELAEELAEALGGAVCASRPIVDQGWLPTSRMVGKSGKNVKPKLYLALGISGAPEHTEGITNSETIIAINMDPTAPIFDVAQYGVEIDLFDLIEVLIDKVREA